MTKVDEGKEVRNRTDSINFEQGNSVQIFKFGANRWCVKFGNYSFVNAISMRVFILKKKTNDEKKLPKKIRSLFDLLNYSKHFSVKRFFD